MGAFVALLAASLAVSVGQVQLLSDHAGFVAAQAPVEAVLATDSAGRSPRIVGPRLPQVTHIDDFTFVDHRHGWVVGWNLNNVGVSVYRTSDGGRRWQSVAVTAHSMAGGSVATIQFLDPKHGWLVNQQPTAPDAALYASTDGGVSWRFVGRGLPQVAPVRFTSLQEAWQAGGFFGRSLFHSRNGGRSWSEVRLRPRSVRRVYELPVVFGREVLAPVTLVRRRGIDLGVFRSDDRGRTWRQASTLGVPSTGGPGCLVTRTRAAPTSVSIATPRAWWAALYRASSWYAYSTTDGGRHWRSTRIAGAPPSAACAGAPSMRALNSNTAWFRFNLGTRDGRLYATRDGGRHWRRILPNMP